MVLAAGRGTRLAPLTDHLPKPLAPVAGRPMIAHVLEFLRSGGIDEVVINLHHLGHLIEEAVGDGHRFGLRVRYSRENPIRDTGGGLKQAEPLLGGEPFVVVNADSLLELPLRDLIAYHERRRPLVTLVVRPDPEATKYGLVELDAENRVRRIAGEPAEAPADGLRGFMFPGIHILEPAVFSWMDADGAFSITRVTYPRLLRGGCLIVGYPTTARWVTIDTPDTLAAADRELRRAPFRFDGPESSRSQT